MSKIDPEPVAFKISGPDNRAHFFKKAPANIFCAKCKSVLDSGYHPSDLRIRTKKDVTSTLDNRLLFSRRIVTLLNEWYPGALIQNQVNEDPALFYLEPKAVLRFDSDKRHTRFLRVCSTCGNFSEVIGVTPGFLRDFDTAIPRGVYRTDLMFGGSEGKQFSILVDPQTKQELERLRFSGIEFHPFYGVSVPLEYFEKRPERLH